MEEYDYKKIDKAINKIKEKNNEEILSEEFKKDLITKMQKIQSEKKVVKFNLKKFSIIVTCLFVLVLGSVFAVHSDNFVINKFSNVDKIVNKAIEKGNIEYVDNMYITNEGIILKADYIIKEENNIYIAIECESIEECVISLDEFEIYENEKKIYDNFEVNSRGCIVQIYYSKEKDGLIFVKIENVQKDIAKIEFIINKINIKKDNNVIEDKINWKVEI